MYVVTILDTECDVLILAHLLKKYYVIILFMAILVTTGLSWSSFIKFVNNQNQWAGLSFQLAKVQLSESRTSSTALVSGQVWH